MRKRYEKYLIFVINGRGTWAVTMLRRMARSRPSRMVNLCKVSDEPLTALADTYFEVPLGQYWLSWSPFNNKPEVTHDLT